MRIGPTTSVHGRGEDCKRHCSHAGDPCEFRWAIEDHNSVLRRTIAQDTREWRAAVAHNGMNGEPATDGLTSRCEKVMMPAGSREEEQVRSLRHTAFDEIIRGDRPGGVTVSLMGASPEGCACPEVFRSRGSGPASSYGRDSPSSQDWTTASECGQAELVVEPGTFCTFIEISI